MARKASPSKAFLEAVGPERAVNKGCNKDCNQPVTARLQISPKRGNLLKRMARPERFERPTLRFVGNF